MSCLCPWCPNWKNLWHSIPLPPLSPLLLQHFKSQVNWVLLVPSIMGCNIFLLVISPAVPPRYMVSPVFLNSNCVSLFLFNIPRFRILTLFPSPLPLLPSKFSEYIELELYFYHYAFWRCELHNRCWLASNNNRSRVSTLHNSEDCFFGCYTSSSLSIYGRSAAADATSKGNRILSVGAMFWQDEAGTCVCHRDVYL